MYAHVYTYVLITLHKFLFASSFRIWVMPISACEAPEAALERQTLIDLLGRRHSSPASPQESKADL